MKPGSASVPAHSGISEQPGGQAAAPHRIADARILVVDDDDFIGAIAQTYLQQAGFRHIEIANDGQTCLDRLRGKAPPHIVILDIKMPTVDGLGVLRQMRQTPALADIPVLVTTGLDESQQRNEAIRAGANSLISKPFDDSLLIEKTRSLIERQILIQQLNLYRERVSRELAMAKDLQLGLLPSPSTLSDIEARYGCRIQSRFESSSELAGDFWGVQPLDATRLAIFNVDISGHGVAAAANTFRLHEIIQSEDLCRFSPAAFLERVNRRFHAHTPADLFATILYGILDIANNSFTYASAAAPPPLVGRVQAPAPRFLPNKGLLVGATAHAAYTAHEVRLDEGDYLFLYSDALPEAATPAGTLLGDAAPAELLGDALAAAPADPLTPLMRAFKARTAPGLQDDLTLIFLSRQSGTSGQ